MTTERKHGTRAMYVQENCRCVLCRDANAAGVRQWRARKHEADPRPDPLAAMRLPDGMDLAWRDHATCAKPEHSLDLFFPERGDNACYKAALAICEVCPVTRECLSFALATGAAGIWGNTTARQRRAMKRVAA